MRASIHTQTHTYIYSYIQTYMHAYIHTYRHACMHAYIFLGLLLLLWHRETHINPQRLRSHRHVARCGRRIHDPWVYHTTTNNWLASTLLQSVTEGRTKSPNQSTRTHTHTHIGEWYQIGRRPVVLLCWMQDSNPGSLPGLWNRITSRLNARWQTELSRSKLTYKHTCIAYLRTYIHACMHTLIQPTYMYILTYIHAYMLA